MSVTLESDAALALRDSIDAAMTPLSGAIMSLKAARATSGWGNGIIDEMRRSIAVIVALEAAADAMDAAHKAAREALKTSMAETGAPKIESAHHVASLGKAPRTVTIIDRDALAKARPDLMTTPEPVPDRKAIGDELRKGRQIEGAALSNGGPEVLRISVRCKS